MSNKTIYEQTYSAVNELLDKANLRSGDLLVVGCSSSEVTGSKIGTNSTPETAKEIFSAIYDAIKEKGIFLAAQCCEHLNRALVIEKSVAKEHNLEIVNAIPQPKAGGSFATAAYNNFEHPVLVERVMADAGLDIGGTLIGMHLKRVAIPVRLSVDHIGNAILIAARTRPIYIGGQRAVYDEHLA
ncbi:MAG: TIGR01440 family protein [Clostridia bacterium]|nr:TIGR01440 family protein [Clostridia bacterium]